jgi:Lrp/AsnC family leucine-responsive transcriptional regulator
VARRPWAGRSLALLPQDSSSSNSFLSVATPSVTAFCTVAISANVRAVDGSDVLAYFGIEMDALDLEILFLIQNDARVANASVGAKLGLTASAVHARIRRLESQGAIRGYLTSINPEAVKQTLLAFIRITNNSSGSDEIAFEESIRTEPSVLECHILSGEDTHMLKIRTDSPASLRDILARLREFPGVARMVTSISLCTIKESGGPPLPRPEPDTSAATKTLAGR